ncbi:sce7725 family protein [Salinicola avicenniae]|uniref:sce7725 family protein n=1 Tax=Salinicola avicenniae TaxID=2916836 RepID=UPI0020747493|nr:MULTISPECIES: sce7725 family protein [unclassified Salinicola]
MYCPYLYGAQSELLALRDYAKNHPNDRVLSPIIEPTKANVSNLATCLRQLSSNGILASVVLNPGQDELSSSQAQRTWYQNFSHQLTAFVDYIPAYKTNAAIGYADIDLFLNAYPAGAVVIHASSHLSLGNFQSVDQDARVRWNVVLPGSINPPQRNTLSAHKTIDIEDRFTVQQRNADYGAPEFFSNQFHTYQQYAVGYGDYTVLSTLPPSSGGQPGAVAIHLTYKDSQAGGVWIEHFVSALTQRSQGDVAGKYHDAATQLVSAANSRPAEFGNNPALISYQQQVANIHFPGLPTNKRQQILHHLCLNRQMATGQI